MFALKKGGLFQRGFKREFIVCYLNYFYFCLRIFHLSGLSMGHGQLMRAFDYPRKPLVSFVEERHNYLKVIMSFSRKQSSCVKIKYFNPFQ